jgi:hypothetical protein
MKFYARWGTSAVAVGLLTFSVVAYATAGNYSAALEAEAYNSQHTCADPPCMQFSGLQADYEATGQAWETLTTVSLVGGILAAAGAGYFWFDELYWKRRHAKAEVAVPAAAPSGEGEDSAFHAVPVITDTFIGGAAVLTF